MLLIQWKPIGIVVMFGGRKGKELYPYKPGNLCVSLGMLKWGTWVCPKAVFITTPRSHVAD